MIYKIFPQGCMLAATSLVFLLGASVHGSELTGQDKAMMIEAARADLYAQFARQIKGLNVTDQTLVANHAVEDSVRRGAVDALVRGAAIGEPQFFEDVCIVAGSITLEQVVENLRNTQRESANGTTSGFESIKRYNEIKTISAQGVGTLRTNRGGKPSAETAESAMAEGPRDDGLKATLAALSGSGQDKLGAIEAARIDALVQLARQIKGVRLSDESLIYNMALDGRWTEAKTQALVQGAQVVRFSPLEGGVVSCVMRITLQQVVENVQRRRTEFGNGEAASYERISRYNPALVTITATGYGAMGKGRFTPTAAPSRIIGAVR